ncbi:MAG: ABC transporter permease subunit [Acidimicrobiaceae bacterium]|nr:ABC transporter permease subunit [Acidimicrobiaceae bacterium]
MTATLTGPRSDETTPSGRHPSTIIARQVGREAVRSGLLWGLAFGVFIVLQTSAYTSQYKTPVARAGLARAYGTNLGLNALLGQAKAINTVGGWVEWRFLGILSILGSVWGLLTSSRLLRGEEGAGRFDLLLVGQTTRGRATIQSLTGLAVGVMAMFVPILVGTIIVGHGASVGLHLGQSLALSAALISGSVMFLTIGSLTSQLVRTRERAAAFAGTLFAVAFALRMVADTVAGAHWLIWLSPLGWIEESHPLTGHDLSPLWIVLDMTIITSVATWRLAQIRDVGAAVFSGSDTSAPHLRLLGNPVTLAIRLARSTIGGWLLSVAAFVILIGATAESATADRSGSSGIGQALGRLGAYGSSVADYLGLTMLMVALIVAMIAATQMTAIRREEADGHLEVLLVRPLRRSSWLAGRVALSVLILVVTGVVGGLGTWIGAASQNAGISLGALILAGFNVVPPAIVLLGLGAMTYGLWPRKTGVVVYGYLAWSFLIEMAGGLRKVSHWLLNSSVFFHMTPAPATNPNWTSATIMIGLGAVGIFFGGFSFLRRDLQTDAGEMS